MDHIEKDKLCDLLKQLEPVECMIDKFLGDIQDLPRTENTLRFSDLDYTLFSRDDQLESEKGLRENRGDEGNKYILFHLGLTYLIDTYYKDKKFPQEIISQMNPSQDVILTAGFPQIQQAKVEAMNLTHFPLIITKDGKEKILACLRYIIYTLKEIPKEIIIYEDRPNYFIEYRDIIEKILSTKLTVMYVEMDGNEGYKKIQEIHQKIS